MSKLIYSLMVSLDGFIETPDHKLDWVIIEEELHKYANDQERAIGTHLYGRRMYELMAEFWPTADTDPSAPDYVVEYAKIWKDMPKIVFSKTLERVAWNSRLVKENTIEEIVKLKAQPGKDLAVCGANLAATLVRLDLIDEYQLFIHPVILGSGTPMFPVLDDPTKLQLVETHVFGTGVVFLRYQRINEDRAA